MIQLAQPQLPRLRPVILPPFTPSSPKVKIKHIQATMDAQPIKQIPSLYLSSFSPDSRFEISMPHPVDMKQIPAERSKLLRFVPDAYLLFRRAGDHSNPNLVAKPREFTEIMTRPLRLADIRLGMEIDATKANFNGLDQTAG
jgi:hypothetical protein